MASKYICKSCERKFIDWGAKKLDFKCPDCDDSELTLINFEPATKAKKKPALKRSALKKVKKLDPAPAATPAKSDDDAGLSADSVGKAASDLPAELDGFSVTDGSEESSK